MVQRTIVKVFDDLDGAEAPDAVTVPFGLDGAEYEIDLKPENAERMRLTMGLFVTHARKVGGKGTRRPAIPPTGDPSKVDARAVREWARSRGYEVSDRGRLNEDLVEEYRRAHR